ncbi:protein of unknown function [Denitratisoma oestradiolicum]|uniref:Uncharacterized protein n=1 Tax=Denitratisoma oestradiolicum TaxID=311182 RepID=A0A6S6XZA2_9PROT|nr:protein of unknown function [Denitratisoma oestradiolicum]
MDLVEELGVGRLREGVRGESHDVGELLYFFKKI